MEEQEEIVESSSDTFSKYGMIPLLLAVCQETNYNLDEVFEKPICMVLTLSCYLIDKKKQEEKQLKQIQNKRGKR